MHLHLFEAMGTLTLVISLVLLVAKAFAFVDALSRSQPAFVAADKQTKAFWLLVLGLSLLAHLLLWHPLGILNLIGTVAALVYLVDVRPALRSLGPRRR